jgi:cysteinyl-tRNA synthetase
LAVLHEWRDHELLTRGLGIFGLASLGAAVEAPDAVRELAAAREDARSRKDFAEADRIREEIEGLGWEVRDDAGGFRLVPR